jgi:hypothetical protein
MTSWNRTNAKAKAKARPSNEQMKRMETLSEDLLGQIRGGAVLKDECHPII